jgi:hypothetical protein
MARLITAEGIVSGLLSMYLAMAKSTPEGAEVAKTLIDKIKADIEAVLDDAPEAVKQETRVNLQALLNRMRTNAPSLKSDADHGPN